MLDFRISKCQSLIIINWSFNRNYDTAEILLEVLLNNKQNKDGLQTLLPTNKCKCSNFQ